MKTPNVTSIIVPRLRRAGFSFVEMIATVAIIGVVSFLAIPSITKMREDSEKNLAISRAEALNVAQATLVQVRGRTQADVDWRNAASSEAKYDLLEPYLSFAETTTTSYMPSGYTVVFNIAINDMNKTRQFGPDSSEIKY